MIRFIIETVRQRKDSSRNCYVHHLVYSTATGEHITINGGWGFGGGNIRHFLTEKNTVDREQILPIVYEVPIREYRRRFDDCAAVHEHELTWEMFEKLEKLEKLAR